MRSANPAGRAGAGVNFLGKISPVIFACPRNIFYLGVGPIKKLIVDFPLLVDGKIKGIFAFIKGYSRLYLFLGENKSRRADKEKIKKWLQGKIEQRKEGQKLVRQAFFIHLVWLITGRQD